MMERTTREPDDIVACLHVLYDGTRLGMLVLQAGQVIGANAAAAGLFGAVDEPLVGQRWERLCRLTAADGRELSADEDPVEMATRTRCPYRSVTLGLHGPDGARRLARIEAIPVPRGDGMPNRVVCVIAEPPEQAEEATLYDPVTGLAGDALFRDRLQHGLATAQRAHWPLALLLTRFDQDMRAVNRRLTNGLLQELGRRMRQTLRDSDTVGRLGDDRFGVLLPATDPAGAVHAARRLWSALQQPYLVQEERIDGGCGIGIAVYPDHGRDAPTLLSAAEAARVAAGRTGRGYAMHTGEKEQFRPPHLALADDLRQAIGRRELLLEYLPLVEIRTRMLWGVEVRLRWRHPRRGAIAADQFMTTAAQIGLVDALTWWTMETALQQRQGWSDPGKHLCLAIPLSLPTLYEPALPTNTGRLLAQHDCPPHLLGLEVAAECLSEHSARSAAMLSRLAETGIYLSLGAPSAESPAQAPLYTLPVRAVAIGRALVRGAREGGAARELVHALIEQCHGRDLRVVAEGVEDQQTWDTLSRLGCDRAWGPYVADPIAAADLDRWLARTEWGRPCP